MAVRPWLMLDRCTEVANILRSEAWSGPM